jgi:hypothetical protein
VRRIWRSPLVRQFLAELAPEEREAFHEHELAVYRDPDPDDVTRFRLPGGEQPYFVYYGPLYELVYRLDPAGPETRQRRRDDPARSQDVLMILTARLADEEAA